MSSWKAKAERGSAGLIHLIAWLARAVGRTVCRALLYPIVLYFVVTDAHRAARIARVPRRSPTAARPAGATCSSHIYCFAATLLDRVCMASGDFERFDVTVEGDALVAAALESGKGCVLLGSHLGSFDLMTLKNKVLHDRPVTVLMHIDERSRVRRIAGIDDSKLSDHSARPLRQLPARLRRARARRHRRRARRSRREGGRAAERLPRPAGAVSDRSACAGGARRGEGADGLRPVRRRRALSHRVRRVRPRRAAPAAAVRRCSRRSTAMSAMLEQYARRYPKNWFNFFPYWDSRQPSRDACSTVIR